MIDGLLVWLLVPMITLKIRTRLCSSNEAIILRSGIEHKEPLLEWWQCLPPKTWSAEPIRLHELLSSSSSRHMVSRVAHGANVTPPLQVRTCLEHLRSVRNKCVKSLRFLPQDHIRIGPKKKNSLSFGEHNPSRILVPTFAETIAVVNSSLGIVVIYVGATRYFPRTNAPFTYLFLSSILM